MYGYARFGSATLGSTSAGHAGNDTWIRSVNYTVHRQTSTAGAQTYKAQIECGSGMSTFADNASEWPAGSVTLTATVGG